jgi:predicted nuclease with TOPRIM domain
MTKAYEEIQKKIGGTLLKLEKAEADLVNIIARLKPLEQQHAKLLNEIKYLKGRIEKLTKLLPES